MKNFYVPVKVLNQCIKQSLDTCMVCNILHPKTTKRYIGLGRSLNYHMAANKNLYCDIAYLNVCNITYYVFILCDQASSYLIVKLFDKISVQNVHDYLLTLYGIIGLNQCLVSDSGGENSELVSKCLQSLGIRHKRISPMASDQNTVESNIRVFRYTIEKMISNCLKDKLRLDFPTLSKLCIITASIIKESSPYNSHFSRKEMYFGMYFSQRGENFLNTSPKKTC